MVSVKQINKHVPMIRFLGKRIFERSKESTMLVSETSTPPPPTPLLEAKSTRKSPNIRSNPRLSGTSYLRQTLSSHEMETIEVSSFLYVG
jgi:hypothetical protein